MLTTRERLEQRHGKDAAPRHEYLQQLIDEFQRSPQMLRQEEIAANLANFCYDPINYASLARLRVMDLFLDILDADQEEAAKAKAKQQQAELQGDEDAVHDAQRHAKPKRNRNLVEFALGGISNCVADPTLQRQFLDGDGLDILAPFVLSVDEGVSCARSPRSAFNAALSALSVAYFLLDSPALAAVTSEPLGPHLQALEGHTDPQIANLAAAIASRRQELRQQA